MKKMYRELRDKGLEVVAVTQYYGFYAAEKSLSKDEEFARMAKYMEEWELPWPMVIGGKDNFEAYGVNGIPQYVVIDRDGKVASINVGYSDELHAKFRAGVEKILSKATASK